MHVTGFKFALLVVGAFQGLAPSSGEVGERKIFEDNSRPQAARYLYRGKSDGPAGAGHFLHGMHPDVISDCDLSS